MNSVINLVKNSKIIEALQGKNKEFVTDDIIGVSLLFASLFDKKPANYLIISSNLYNAQRISDRIATLIGEDNVLLYPSDELLRAENLSSNKELLSQRLYVLSKLVLSNKPHIVVAHASSLIRFLPNPKLFKERSFELKVGENANIIELEQTLIKAGYSKVNKIDQSLQFARRGDILDIYPIIHNSPIRITFFDDEIERISYFDISTQTSSKRINKVIISPANDTLLTDEEYYDVQNKLLTRLSEDEPHLGDEEYKRLENVVSNIIFYYENYACNAQQYKYYGFLQNEHYSLVDYAKWEMAFIANKSQYQASLDILYKESSAFLHEQFEAGKCLSHLEMFLMNEKILSGIKNLKYNNDFKFGLNATYYPIRPVVFEGNSSTKIIATIFSYINQGNKVILSVVNPQQEALITELLKENHLDYEFIKETSLPSGLIGVGMFSFIEGFELVDDKLVVLSPKELFGYASHSSRFQTRFKESTILRTYEDLKPGDYVVHEYNGIGQFIDIINREIGGESLDYIHIKYANDMALYVPLSQIKLIRKFSGREGATPRLSTLGTGDWQRTKQKIAKRVDDVADRLIKLYKERMEIKGYKFQEDDELQHQFENEFPYELTDDQLSSLKEIKEDMESDIAMDRLLCGDVGFGKTEVAFRAAFKAINNGKQVAILCPTTLLARQHYEVALERFQNYGIRIAILSRLIPEKKQKEYIKDIKEGKVHLIIGTHRLLSNKIEFNNLGLLIVDEEQRFGVIQKEIIKEIKNSVDVLTLSATPIPRTLQMSLVGVRTLSQINTAPKNRVAVQTYVTAYDEKVIKELIERELSRSGQVFYLINNITRIYLKANRLEKLIPTAKIGIVHGQMEKDDIEDVMIKFYSGEINLLLCTSVVENGIDVPNANMIVVENADKFGLSQLYQIKGRVGRGDRIAYAYFLYRDDKKMTENATKRLKAIQDFTELGSGYKIAQRDLMIRGAGDILGAEQAGFIDCVGMDLYLKMLNDSILEKTGRKKSEPVKYNLSLGIGGKIPDNYADKSDLIEIYQEIEYTKTFDELDKVRSKINDIYGRLPDEVRLLINKQRINIYLSSSIYDKVSDFTSSVDLILSKSFSGINGIANELFDKLYPFIRKIKVTYAEKQIRIKVKKDETFVTTLEDILSRIASISENFKCLKGANKS